MDIALVKDVSLLMNAVGAGNCFLLSVVYLRKNEYKAQGPSRVLSLLFFILGAIILNTIFNFTGHSQLLNGFEPLTNAFGFAIAPLLLLYIRPHNRGISKHIFLWSRHLILFHTILVLTLFAVWIPNSFLGALGQLIIKSELMRLLWNIHFLAYLIIIIRDFRKKNRSQSRTQRTLVWGISSIWFLNLLFYVHTIWINPLPTIIYLNITLLFSAMTLWLFYQKLGVVERRNSGKTPKIKADKSFSIIDGNDPIVVAIKKNKYYKNPYLDIRTLSDKLQLPYHELSIKINQEFGQNFNEFINSFRVQEVVLALQSQQHQSYTIMGLAQEAGFKSASAFYAAFKKEKGTTPTLFIEHNVKPTQLF